MMPPRAPPAARLLFPAPSKLLLETALPVFARRISSSFPWSSSSSSSSYSSSSSSSSGARGARNDTTAAWPMLKRRERAPSPGDGSPGGHGLLAHIDVAATASPSSSSPLVVQQPAPAAAVGKADARLMLTIHGLSPNLNASDFYRLAPSDLASWHSVIKKVQQQRDPHTLEPLGRYLVSFATPAAATAYRDRLVRLHRLARHRQRSPSGLWEASAPAHLRSPAGVEPAAELATFTLAPPSSYYSSSSSASLSSSAAAATPGLDVDRRRVSAGAGAWARRLADLVRGAEHAYGDKPHVVLLRVCPPTLSAEDLRRSVRDDGAARGCRWKVSAPRPLQAAEEGHDTHEDGDAAHQKSSTRAHKDRDTLEQQRGRFVVVCATEAEARRFHRHWNQRSLPARHKGHGDGTGDGVVAENIVHASIINW